MNTGMRYLIIGLLAWMASLQAGWGFFNPETGRWLSRDPIEELGFQKLNEYHLTLTVDNGKNNYSFNLNNPLYRIDRLGLDCTCGPDVTDALAATLTEVERQFALLDDFGRLKACAAVAGLGADPASAWDIDTLAYTSPFYRKGNPKYQERDPLEKGISSHCCPSSCTDTVVIAGKCVHSDQGTYALFGKIAKLCGANVKVLHPIIDKWKKNYPGAERSKTDHAHAMTDYGNSGNFPSEFVGLECYVDPKHPKTRLASFEWTWEPFHPRKPQK